MKVGKEGKKMYEMLDRRNKGGVQIAEDADVTISPCECVNSEFKDEWGPPMSLEYL